VPRAGVKREVNSSVGDFSGKWIMRWVRKRIVDRREWITINVMDQAPIRISTVVKDAGSKVNSC